MKIAGVAKREEYWRRRQAASSMLALSFIPLLGLATTVFMVSMEGWSVLLVVAACSGVVAVGGFLRAAALIKRGLWW